MIKPGSKVIVPAWENWYYGEVATIGDWIGSRHHAVVVSVDRQLRANVVVDRYDRRVTYDFRFGLNELVEVAP